MVTRIGKLLWVLIAIIIFQSFVHIYMVQWTWNDENTYNTLINESKTYNRQQQSNLSTSRSITKWIFAPGWLASGTPIKKYDYLSLHNLSADNENLNEINYRISELKRLTLLHNGDVFTSYGWIKTHIRPKQYWHFSWENDTLSTKPYLGSYYLKHKYGKWCTLKDTQCIQSFEKKAFNDEIQTETQCTNEKNIKKICIPFANGYSEILNNELFYRISKGYQRVQNYKIAIGVAVKNDAKKLEKMIHLFTSLGTNFKDYRIIFMENDSTDRTNIEVQKHCKNNDKIICVNGIFHLDKKLKEYGGMSVKRLSTMSLLRQNIVNIVKYLLIDFDYLLMTDSDEITAFDDDLNRSIWPHVIMTSFYGSSRIFDVHHEKPKWSFVCANGIAKQRRMWDTFPFYPLFVDSFFMHLDWDSHPGASIQKIDPWEDIAIKYNIDMIPVASCYAPFGIYNMESIRKTQCQYDSINDEGTDVHQPPVSEHATLNHCLDSHNQDSEMVAVNFLNPFMLGLLRPENKNHKNNCKSICLE
eukprot:1012787_1